LHLIEAKPKDLFVQSGGEAFQIPKSVEFVDFDRWNYSREIADSAQHRRKGREVGKMTENNAAIKCIDQQVA
jgi:hypothetical protein